MVVVVWFGVLEVVLVLLLGGGDDVYCGTG